MPARSNGERFPVTTAGLDQHGKSRAPTRADQEVDEARILDVADELVDQRRQNAADALRYHDQAHALAVAHAERPAGLHLPALDALDARAEDFADIGAGDKAKGENAERKGRRPENFTADAGKALADQQNGDDRRKATENIGVDPGGNAQPARLRNAHDRQDHAENDTQYRGRGREDQGVLQTNGDHARQHVRHGLPVEETAPQVFEPVHSVPFYTAPFVPSGNQAQRRVVSAAGRQDRRLRRGLLLGEILVGHRRTGEPLLVERLPGAVLHGRMKGSVQCLAKLVVALATTKPAGASKEGILTAIFRSDSDRHSPWRPRNRGNARRRFRCSVPRRRSCCRGI